MSRFFIDRPVFAWVLSIVIVVCGIVCYEALPTAQYPPIVPPTIQVTATYPGASAKTVADSVGQPIEEQVNGVEGMIYMSSTCTNNGNYTLTVSFDVGTDVHTAADAGANAGAIGSAPASRGRSEAGRERADAVAQHPAGRQPDLAPTPATTRSTWSNYAQINLFDSISRVLRRGAGDVSRPASSYSMRAWLDPQKLASLDMTASQVIDSIQEQNADVAAGIVGQQPVPEGSRTISSRSPPWGRLTTGEQFGNIIVKVGQDGRYVRPARRSALSGCNSATQNSDLICTLSSTRKAGKKSQEVAQYPSGGNGRVQRLADGQRALSTGDGVKRKMEELKQAGFPQGLDYLIAYDTTPFIRHSVDDDGRSIRSTWPRGLSVVIVVIMVFLQDWRAMLLPIIDIVVAPRSRHVRVVVMKAAQVFALNNLFAVRAGVGAWESSSMTRSWWSRTSNAGWAAACRPVKRPSGRWMRSRSR